MNLSGPGLFLVSRLLIAASISELVIGLFRGLTREGDLFTYTLPGLILGGCVCPGVYPFLLDFLVYLQRG